MTVDQALSHPYLSAYVRTSALLLYLTLKLQSHIQHDPEDEPAVTPLSPSYFQCDLHKDDLTKDQLKGTSPSVFRPRCRRYLKILRFTELLYEEVLSFVPSI